MDTITKKYKVGKIIKEKINVSIDKSEQIMKEEIIEEKLNLLVANEETIRSKLSAVTNLVEKFLNLWEDPTEINNLLTDGVNFEITYKEGTLELYEFIQKRKTKTEQSKIK